MTNIMNRWKALGSFAALAAAAAAIAFGITHLTSDESELEGAYALMTRAMSRPGMVLHTTSTRDSNPTCVSITEGWVSEGGEEVRTQSSYHCAGIQGEERTMLSVRGGWYLADSEGTFQSRVREGCRGTTLPGLLFVLQCEGDADVAVMHSRVDFDGRNVLQIRSIGEAYGTNSRLRIDNVLFVDPETGLPIAAYTEQPRGNSWTTYEHEYVERSSLPADFFEPAGIGFKDPGVR